MEELRRKWVMREKVEYEEVKGKIWIKNTRKWTLKISKGKIKGKCNWKEAQVERAEEGKDEKRESSELKAQRPHGKHKGKAKNSRGKFINEKNSRDKRVFRSKEKHPQMLYKFFPMKHWMLGKALKDDRRRRERYKRIRKGARESISDAMRCQLPAGRISGEKVYTQVPEEPFFDLSEILL